MTEKTKRIYSIPLGCSKNQVDTENILGEFNAAGYQMANNADEADYLLINTCGFIGDAKEESVDEITARIEERSKANKKQQKIIVAGCLSERYKEELLKELPEIDLLFGTYKPGEIITQLEGQASCPPLSSRVLLGSEKAHAFLKIAEGCNRQCSFCAIPGIRGKQDSRKIEDLVKEAQNLQDQGIQEISLIAQDLSFFGRERQGVENLELLLQSLLKETDIPWIRLMYAYPAYIEDSLIDLMANEKRICSYLDMPIQHASDSVLKNMQRGYSAESLRKLLRKLRSGVPDIAMRTTVLTGFPGETQNDFEQLLDLMEEIQFERLGAFAYSPEENTPAEELKHLQSLERVSEEEAQERVRQIMELQSMISLEKNQRLIGKELDVLVDEVAEESEFHFYARTQWDAPEVDNQVRILEGSATPGTFRRVKIIDAYEYDLDAILL